MLTSTGFAAGWLPEVGLSSTAEDSAQLCAQASEGASAGIGDATGADPNVKGAPEGLPAAAVGTAAAPAE